MKRRDFILASSGVMAGLAGCNTKSGDGDPGTSTSTETGTTEQTETGTVEKNEPGDIQLSVENGQVTLPPVWGQHNIDSVTPQVNASVSDPDGVASVHLQANGETIREFDSWESGTEKNFTLPPSALPAGETQLTFQVEDGKGETFNESTTLQKQVPSAFKIDVVPGKNEELRTQAHDTEGEKYLTNQTPLNSEDGLITDDPVFAYSSHEDLSFDKLPVDLAAMEYLHDNDTHFVSERHHEEIVPLLDALGTGEGFPEARSPDPTEKPYSNTMPYPNSDYSASEKFNHEDGFGHFVYSELTDSTNAGEALDWLHPLLFGYQRVYTQTGPESSEDFMYATFFQEAFDEHTDLETHVWPFKIGINGEHGNGLIWDETSNELRIMETIAGPPTAEYTDDGKDYQYHPTVKDANYMKGDWLWHPLRFGLGQEEADRYGWEPDRWPDEDTFARKKVQTTGMLSGMTSTYHDMDFNENGMIAPTTGYIESFTERLRNYNSNNFDFQQLLNQSKIVNKLATDSGNFVIYGDVDNPQYAKVSDDLENGFIPSHEQAPDNILYNIWKDMEGEYDDFDQYVEENASYEEVNAGLNGRQDLEALGQALEPSDKNAAA